MLAIKEKMLTSIIVLGLSRELSRNCRFYLGLAVLFHPKIQGSLKI